ncbi:porin [Candidatus Pelagibacter sp.]|nr:porin [Candidatus Pelagibacter sp.]
MNNLKKVGLSALAGSLVAFSASAAEFSVTGSASLTYANTERDNTGTTGQVNGNPYTMGNSLGFNASGETDGGLGVAVYYELDDDVMDDYDMTLSGDFGSLKFHGSGGSTAFGAVDDVTPNAYEEAWDIIDTDGTATAGSPTVIGGGSGANMFVYTSPDFSGATLTASMVPSGNVGGSGTQTEFAIAISPEAVEGLTIGGAVSNQEVATKDVDKSTMYVKYVIGGITAGVQLADLDHDTASSSQESMAFGVSYAVNDNFSIAYNEHELEFDTGASANKDQTSTGISASYTMGGMTLAGAMNEVDNMDGAATADHEGYEFNLKFAF